MILLQVVPIVAAGGGPQEAPMCCPALIIVAAWMIFLGFLGFLLLYVLPKRW